MNVPHVTNSAALTDFHALRFDNSFVRELPADPLLQNVPRQVKNACYTRVEPTPVTAPRLLAWADAVGKLLGVAPPQSTYGPIVELLAGNRLLPGMQPYAARYGGHQFGHWAGQLGDGRAITLGEVIGPDGQRCELQLKGAGKTPYSRTADGRAVLRSSVREFLCSEAMHYLGVPTTRALSLVATGETVVRDMFYDGHPQAEPGAVVCRVAPSFVRFGNFEILAANEEFDSLKRLADYVIATHFPELKLSSSSATSSVIYASWFEAVCQRTAVMLAHWMRVGFVHGVINTDNMSILGLTIDYGPYGWLEGFDPGWTPNTTDAEGRRYCYGNQPQIARWNLTRLAIALTPLVEDNEVLKGGLIVFEETFSRAARQMLADKLGLLSIDKPGDKKLLGDLLTLLQKTETDMTLFFRGLAAVSIDATAEAKITDDANGLQEPLRRAFYVKEVLDTLPYRNDLVDWLQRYRLRVQQEGQPDEVRRAQMNRANPKYVLRNYLAQQAIEALEQGDASVLNRLMDVLQRPYDEQPENDDLAARRPEWARNKAGCSALSCSS